MTVDVEKDVRHYSVLYHDILEAVPNAKALCLYMILLKFADNKTKEAHPSRTTLAKMMGYKSPQVADDAIEYLKSLGLVETFPRYRDSSGNISRDRDDQFREQTSNGYVVHDTVDPLRVHGRPPYVHTVDPPTRTRSTPLRVHGDELIPKGTTTQGTTTQGTKANRFDEFWKVVPRKVKRANAEGAYAKAVQKVGDEQVIIDGMIRFANDPNLPEDKQFIPHPSTWLNDGRWDDEPLPPRAGSGASPNTPTWEQLDNTIDEMRMNDWKQIG